MKTAVVLSCLLATTHVLAADATSPHPHKGILKPYPQPPPPLKLSPEEQARLDQGKSVMRQTDGGEGGRGLAIFRVDASPETTWAIINDFPSYPKWIDEVKKCEVYNRDSSEVDVHYEISSFPVTIEYYVHHQYDPNARWVTWTLDYSRESDLDDSVGFWRVNPVPGNPNQSIVEYSVDIRIKGWVPAFVRELLVDKGLKQATRWVKVQSEKRAART